MQVDLKPAAAEQGDRNAPAPPPKFRLPQIEELRSWLGGLPPWAQPLFVKIDLQNAY